MLQPLQGIRVLELARTLAGPFCGMILGDMGADVIKVEQPGVGDETRHYKPPEWGGESCYYLSLNRNKKSITVNLKSEQGREIIKALAAQSDVLIENFRTGTMEKFGLGYEELKKINPELVYCAVSGFGRRGPLKDEPAYDLLMQAFGGLMSVTGEPEGPPVRVGFSIVDLATGLYAAFGVMAALFARTKTGKGQYVEVSLLQAVVSLQTYLGQSFLATGESPGRMGSGHPNLAPYQAFEAGDGYVIIAVPNDWLWIKMCDALGLEHLKNDPRFKTNKDRVKHREVLVELITDFTRRKSREEIISRLKKAGVPCGPINTVGEVLTHPQVVHLKMVEEVPHPTIGIMKLLGIPLYLSDTPGSIRLAPPLLGEHTEEVLQGLGYSEADIENLRKEGVI
ncbi:CaiB/BaiF CoA transferase family protein [Thermodesulforhabdus norvegica]|uniref:Formyl-CoA transferase n=1 Tax=Thermodesulforhabdus norvegica TaxID=39841 RepID=A0A1I4R395_9BACT|nr:CaiB/BaiF CoA-transferase family protein [Thermodesulforhabdus norvegica]SFM46393.1 formyl-CoA transferase [Thermodesulforhabdus norvegica]